MTYLLDLQFFADEDEDLKDDEVIDESKEDEAEGTDGSDDEDKDENGSEDEDENAEDDVFAPVITFDEILSDKMYQSEFDKKVQKALATNAEKFEEQIKELQEYKDKYEKVDNEFSDYKKTATETEKKITRDKAVEVALAKSGTQDEIALKAHLNEFLEDAEFDDKGEVVGMAERIKELQGSHKHLFGKPKKATGFELGKGDVKNIDEKSKVENAMGVRK